MSKRDTIRVEPDWDTVARAYEAQRQAAMNARDMRELMMPERGVIVDECRWGRT